MTMLLLLSPLLEVAAHAALVSQTICGRHVPDFLDAHPSVGDDLVTDNDPRPANGMRLRLHLGSATGTVVLDTHMDEDGCTTVGLNDIYQYYPRFSTEY